MGNITKYTYDPLQRLAYLTEAKTNTTAYAWCDCGDQPESVTRAHGTALAQTTFFDYDYQGNLLTNTLPEGSTLIHRYDALGR
ncbi:MAG TPA: RHS repeat protein, partial [Verrucomicrobiota bacterium]|nr:RHS repeat protein [Verrucomicrobiota bacterium]